MEKNREKVELHCILMDLQKANIRVPREELMHEEIRKGKEGCEGGMRTTVMGEAEVTDGFNVGVRLH